MYHIPNDKRAYRSAEVIENGLIEILKKKPIQEVTIADIHRACGVSRATFYRLFDTPNDVLAYRCHLAFESIRDGMKACKFKEQKEVIPFFFRCCLEHDELFHMLFKNNLLDLCQEELLKNEDLVRATFTKASSFTPAQWNYLITILAGMMPSVLQVWYQNGKQETAEDLFENITSVFALLSWRS